jgi:hypothetical protein
MSVEQSVEWELAGETEVLREKSCPSATLPTTSPTLPYVGTNPGRRSGKPATNRLSYCAASGIGNWCPKPTKTAKGKQNPVEGEAVCRSHQNGDTSVFHSLPGPLEILSRLRATICFRLWPSKTSTFLEFSPTPRQSCSAAQEIPSPFIELHGPLPPPKRNTWSGKKKGKAIPVTDRGGPQSCKTSRLPYFLDNGFTDGGEVSLKRHPPFTPQKDSWYSFLLEAESTPGP